MAVLGSALFEQTDLYGMKSDMYMYTHFQKFLKDKGIEFNTQTFISPASADIIICLNETAYFESYKVSEKNKHIVLILTEPPVYNQMDWSAERHQYFQCVFTYDADLVKSNPSKYVKIVFPIDLNMTRITSDISEDDFKQKKFACQVAGTFSITQPKPHLKSLLHERYRVIKWYNKYEPNKLDFFSRSNPLDKCQNFEGARITNAINRRITKWIAQLIYKKNIAKIYKGAIPAHDKVTFMHGYKFSFCFENTEKVKGLISEKIFECFFAKTIPIYLGAPDILEHIPQNTFIAFHDFTSLKALHNYLEQMPYEVYKAYIDHAQQFLDTSAIQSFTTQYFSETIYSIIKD